MKALAFVLFLAAATLQAAPQRYGFETSKLTAGVAHVFNLDDSVTVTIRRDGEIRRIT